MSLRRYAPTWPLAVLAVHSPIASAKQCTTTVEDLCDAAKTAQLDRVFGQWADFGLIFVGLLAAAVVFSLFVWLGRRLFRRARTVRLSVKEAVQEVEPGGTTRLAVQVENPNSTMPVEFFVEPGVLPEGWSSTVQIVQELPSGFRLVHKSNGASDWRLEGARGGRNKATLQVSLTAPPAAVKGQSVDGEVRVVPYRLGRLKPRKTKLVTFNVLVTSKFPAVVIRSVLHQPEQIRSGTKVVTRARLVNQGEKEAQDVAVQFLVNGQEVDRKVVPALGPAAESDIEFQWTAQPGENHIRVAVA